MVRRKDRVIDAAGETCGGKNDRRVCVPHNLSRYLLRRGGSRQNAFSSSGPLHRVSGQGWVKAKAGWAVSSGGRVTRGPAGEPSTRRRMPAAAAPSIPGDKPYVMGKRLLAPHA